MRRSPSSKRSFPAQNVQVKNCACLRCAAVAADVGGIGRPDQLGLRACTGDVDLHSDRRTMFVPEPRTGLYIGGEWLS